MRPDIPVGAYLSEDKLEHVEPYITRRGMAALSGWSCTVGDTDVVTSWTDQGADHEWTGKADKFGCPGADGPEELLRALEVIQRMRVVGGCDRG